MVRSNTLVFCIVVLAMAATYCTGWSKQQDNLGINRFMELLPAKREFQDQLFGEVDASRRLPRTVSVHRPIVNHGHGAVSVRRPIGNHGPGRVSEDVEDHPTDTRRPTRKRPKARKPPCPCPCGHGSYNMCHPGCDKGGCLDCPCPCENKGYMFCPPGCRPRTICGIQ